MRKTWQNCALGTLEQFVLLVAKKKHRKKQEFFETSSKTQFLNFFYFFENSFFLEVGKNPPESLLAIRAEVESFN